MIPCECGGTMFVKGARRKTKGLKTGKLPGWSRTYECRTCKKTTITVEIDPALLEDLQQQFQERRLAQNAVIADLKQQIYYLKMPVKSGERRIRRIRKKLLDILDDTF